MARANSRKKKGIFITIGLIILTKLKSLLALLKFFKFGGTLISMFVSLAAYAVLFGWKFAIVLIYLLFVHEMGHLIAARQKGIKTTPAVFVPFLGAVIGMKEQPKDAATEAYVAYGGPLAGLLSIIPGFIMFHLTSDPLWALVVYIGAMLNLFNLIPVSPLDGGRIVGVLSTKLWFIGLVLIGVYFYFSQAPILIIVLIFGVIHWWSRIRTNYSFGRINNQLESREQLLYRINQLEADLFYEQSFYSDDEPMVNHDMKFYVVRQLRDEVKSIEDRLSDLKDWYVPFAQDKEKLKKERLKQKKQLMIQFIELVQALHSFEDWSRFKQNIQTNVAKIQKEKGQLKTYYQADGKTKWKVFGAYILLAIVLSLALVYANEILSVVRHQMMYM